MSNLAFDGVLKPDAVSSNKSIQCVFCTYQETEKQKQLEKQ